MTEHVDDYEKALESDDGFGNDVLKKINVMRERSYEECEKRGEMGDVIFCREANRAKSIVANDPGLKDPASIDSLLDIFLKMKHRGGRIPEKDKIFAKKALRNFEIGQRE